ncbi:SCO family protein [Litorilinea aerophila]|nr:SCO family protein [Litorilinea aerophila]MCC9077717.1 SCO family protein [Litorilinea aerophila]GIV77000.1 MAG: electron transporter SenC [Litorilinea sp.]
METTVPSQEGQATQRIARRPWRHPLVLGLAVMLVVAVGLLLVLRLRPPELHGVLIQSPQQADDFTLTAMTGEPVSLSDFRGRYVLLYFGYTFCPDVCPTTLNDLAAMADILGERKMEQVQVLFVSVDPARDTPEHLASYLPHFNPSFLGLTGPEAQIQQVASQFGIYFERRGEPGTAYTVDHTSVVIAVDPEGYVRMIFPYGTTAEEMAADMSYLLRRF